LAFAQLKIRVDIVNKKSANFFACGSVVRIKVSKGCQGVRPGTAVRNEIRYSGGEEKRALVHDWIYRLKKFILAWAGTKPAVGYSAQMSKIELVAIYKKIQELESKT